MNIYLKKKYFIFIIISSLLSIVFFTQCGKSDSSVLEEKTTPVKLVKIQKQIVPIPIFASGQLSPEALIKLSFKTGGIIRKLYANSGETVSKGKTLATLDLSEIQAQYSQAKNAFEKSQRDLNRIRNLYNDHAATLSQLQDVETAFNVSQSTLKIAQFNLDHSTIIAPAEGKILKRLAEEGEMTGPGIPVFLFGSTQSQWVVKAGISERDVVRLTLRDKASLRFDAYPGKTFSAYVSEIPDSIDPASGTYEVELTLENTNTNQLKLTAGFVADTTIIPSTGESYFLVPIDSIVDGEGSKGSVFTVQNNRAVRVKVEIVHLFPQYAAVKSGLDGIEMVVTSGAPYLRDGAAVIVSPNTGGNPLP